MARKNNLRPTGFEPATTGFEVRDSIQMSYGRDTRRQHFPVDWVPGGDRTHDNQIHNLALYR